MRLFKSIIILMKGVENMYSERIYLSPQELLDYEFKVDARGYRAQEVDKVLDMVIRDETEYINEIKRLNRHIKDLNDDNSKLKQELRRVKLEIEESQTQETSNTSSNIDLLKRISNLEKIVYNKFE